VNLFSGAVKGQSLIAQLTETQFVGIPTGSLGTVSGTPIPDRCVIPNQGALTIATSGTQLTQPLSDLWKVKSANEVAKAEVNETRKRSRRKTKLHLRFINCITGSSFLNHIKRQH